MQIYQQLATRNDCYRRNQAELAKSPGSRDSRYARYYRGPRGVMIHSTGANNPNLRRYVQPDDGILGANPNNNDWNRPGLDVAVHAFIGLTQAGEVAAYQILPWEYRAWHCGGSGNDTHLSFEICEGDLEDKDYFEKTYQTAMELTAELCRKFGLDPLAPGVVIDHAEGADLGIASNHADVDHWWSRFGVSMDDFRAGVARLLQEATRPLYRVRKSWADKDSQIGAFADLGKAKAACPVGYSVYDKGGNAVYVKSKEDIDMTRDEVQKMIRDAIAADRESRTFATLDKVQDWARPTAKKLVDEGVLQGDGQALNLSYDLLRALVALDRLGKLD